MSDTSLKKLFMFSSEEIKEKIENHLKEKSIELRTSQSAIIETYLISVMASLEDPWAKKEIEKMQTFWNTLAKSPFKQ